MTAWPEIPSGYHPIHEVMAAEGRAAVAADIMDGKRTIQVAGALGIWTSFPSHLDGPEFWATAASDQVAATGILAFRQGGNPIYNKVFVIVSELVPTEKLAEPAKPARKKRRKKRKQKPHEPVVAPVPEERVPAAPMASPPEEHEPEPVTGNTGASGEIPLRQAMVLAILDRKYLEGIPHPRPWPTLYRAARNQPEWDKECKLHEVDYDLPSKRTIKRAVTDWRPCACERCAG